MQVHSNLPGQTLQNSMLQSRISMPNHGGALQLIASSKKIDSNEVFGMNSSLPHGEKENMRS